MKKFLLVLSALLILTVPVFAEESETETETEGYHVISLEEAVELALGDMLSVQDIESAIRDMQMHKNDLSDQLERMERGDARIEAINTLHETLLGIETAIMGMNAAQGSMDAQMEQAFAAAMAAMAMGSPDANLILQGIWEGMAAGQVLSSELGGLHMARDAVFTELTNLSDPNFFEDIIDGVRSAVDVIERQMQNLRITQEIIEISLENGLRSILLILADMDSAMELLELSMELGNENLRRMNVMYSVGLISSHELRGVEHAISQNEVQHDALIHGRETVVRSLNQMLGLPLDTQTVIELERGIPEIPEDEYFDDYLMELILQSPTIRQLQYVVDDAKRVRRDYIADSDTITAERGTGNIRISDRDRNRAMQAAAGSEENIEQIMALRNRIAIQEAVERAIAERDQAIRTMEAAIRQAYRELDSHNVQLAARERELARAIASLGVAEANLSAGRVTPFDVAQAEMAVINIELAIEGIFNQICFLLFTIENPSLL
ncbi:MAG: TolC family protein [Defluviitaleaceae bacterium]|nr:TolC family protein [Defluviitaleaceae bacterium]